MTVMPSLEEGFGLPVAESMACGTPVICSNAASLPEVAAGAAISFDPYSPENLTEAIATLLDSADMRQKAIASGLRRAKDFSLDQFAKQQTLAINKLISV
jgi:glycosyltransferase involved in cell wall biosynthesis